jgi:thymidylate kinase
MDPTQDDLARLEQRAREVLAKLSPSHDPFVIEFAGSPKAGKSTTIDILHHFLRRMGFKVWAPTEGASKRTPYHLKRDLVAYNAWTLNYAISEMLVAYYNVDQQNIVILDRGPFDSLAWMGILRDRRELPRAQYEIFRAFALHPKWSTLVRRVYLFKCSREVSLARELQSKLTREGGVAMNEKTLDALLDQYSKLQTELKQYPLKVVETSPDTTPLRTSYDLMVDLLEMMERADRQGTQHG